MYENLCLYHIMHVKTLLVLDVAYCNKSGMFEMVMPCCMYEKSEVLTKFIRKLGREGPGILGNWGVDGSIILKR